MNQSGGNLDPYLFLIKPDGYFLTQDDDSNGGVNSRIPSSLGNITLPQTGVYIIEATSFGQLQTGSYTITINDASCTISTGQGSFQLPAGGGSGSLASLFREPVTNTSLHLINPRWAQTGFSLQKGRV